MWYQIEWMHSSSDEWARIPNRYEDGSLAVDHAQQLSDQCPKAQVRVVRCEPEVVWASHELGGLR